MRSERKKKDEVGKNDEIDFLHYYDKEHIDWEAEEPEHIHYQPVHPSEHHPLPVYYDVFWEESDKEEDTLHSLHPLDPTRRKTPSPKLAKPIEPVKKYIEYYGSQYLL